MLTRDYLSEGLKRTCEELRKNVSRTPLKFWNESVFRYHLIGHLLDIDQSRVWDVEWKRVDLIVVGDTGDKVPVEVKFWCFRGERENYRGGPSPQNQREYRKVVGKLIESKRAACFKGHTVKEAYLILLYADPAVAAARPTFGQYYDELVEENCKPHLVDLCEFTESDTRLKMTCKLLEFTLP